MTVIDIIKKIKKDDSLQKTIVDLWNVDKEKAIAALENLGLPIAQLAVEKNLLSAHGLHTIYNVVTGFMKYAKESKHIMEKYGLKDTNKNKSGKGSEKSKERNRDMNQNNNSKRNAYGKNDPSQFTKSGEPVLNLNYEHIRGDDPMLTNMATTINTAAVVPGERAVNGYYSISKWLTAIQNIYTDITQKNYGSNPFEVQDLAKYIEDQRAAHILFAEIGKLLKLRTFRNGKFNKTPIALYMSYLGWEYDHAKQFYTTVSNKAANYINKYNDLVYTFNEQIRTIPGMSVMERDWHHYASLFKDSNTPNASYMLIRPLFIMNVDDEDEEAAIKLNNLSLLYGSTNPNVEYGLDTAFEILEKILGRLESATQISTYIYKAYGDDAKCHVPTIKVEDKISPLFDKLFSSQIANAVCLKPAAVGDWFDSQTFVIGDDAFVDEEIPFNPAVFGTEYVGTEVPAVINSSLLENPTPAQTMELVQYTTPFEIDRDGLCLAAKVSTIVPYSFNITYAANSGMSVLSGLTNIAGSSIDLGPVNGLLTQVSSGLSYFNITQEDDSAEPTKGPWIIKYGNLENWAFLDATTAKDINSRSTYSLYKPRDVSK